MKTALERGGLKIVGSEISMKPKNSVKIEEAEKAKKVLDFLDKIDDLADVQKIYANFDIPEDILEKETA